MYTSSEVKSGFLIVFSLAVLFALTVKIGNMTAAKTQTWQVEFGYLGGLEDNAPVYFAGKESGKVSKIEIRAEKERPILITFQLAENINLREGTKATIDTLGMMGEKFLEITPGPEDAAAMGNNHVIAGDDPIAMHEMIRKMNLLADRMDEMTANLNPMTAQLNDALKGNGETVGRMIANFEEVSANLRDMTHDLKRRPWRLVRKGD